MNDNVIPKNGSIPDPGRRRLIAQLTLGIGSTVLSTPICGRVFGVTASATPSAGNAHSDRPLGIFTHIVPGAHATKAKLVREAGFTCVQWYPALDRDVLTADTFRRVADAYSSEGITIAAVAAYANLFDPRPEFRSAERKRLSRILQLAPECGCCLVCTETGTLNTMRGSHPHNTRPDIWNEFVDLICGYLDEAARAGSTLALEAYTKNICRDTYDIRRLLASVSRSPSLRFVADPFNILYEFELSDQRPVLREYLDVIGNICVVAHAKDLIFEACDKATPRAGTGIFDWPAYAELLNHRLPTTPLILEHLKWTEVPGTFSFVREQFRRISNRH